MLGFGQNKMVRGFSLIEAMVSLSILIVGLAGLAVAFQSHVYQNVSARNQAQAASIAHTVFVELSSTNPSAWNMSQIKNTFIYSFEGQRVSEGSPEAFYHVEVEAEGGLGLEPIAIGVTWKGWEQEMEKSGFGNSSSEFAYVLNVSLTPLYSSTE